MQSLNESILQLATELRRLNATLVTAESCTGGEIAARLTDIAGSSEWFDGGIVSYSNRLKIQLLDVSSLTLDTYGAVSQFTAEQMASGACKRLGADYAVATTGIAGPGGATADKPVGLVWFAVADNEGVRSEAKEFAGNRTAVRQAATHHAVLMALNHLKSIN